MHVVPGDPHTWIGVEKCPGEEALTLCHLCLFLTSSPGGAHEPCSFENAGSPRTINVWLRNRSVILLNLSNRQVKSSHREKRLPSTIAFGERA